MFVLCIFCSCNKQMKNKITTMQIATFITVDTIKYDMGILDEDSKPKLHSFRMKNNSKNIVKISFIKTFCNCITATVSKKIIEPYDTFTATIIFNPAGRKGRFYREVIIFINDGASFVKLIAYGTVK